MKNLQKGGFFMQKFKGIADAVLIDLYRKGNRDAEIELVDRYRIRSAKLASDILKTTGMTGYVDISDLINLGLISMYDALKKYRNINSFYAYWKRIASNNITVEINEIFSKSEYNYFGPSMDYAAMSFASEQRDLLEQDVANAFDNPKNKFKPGDKAIFYMVLDGYSVQEIADVYHVSYQAINYRLKRITNKLSNILFNS